VQGAGVTGTFPSLTTLLADPAQTGPQGTLPADIVFDDGTNCPGFAPNEPGFRFQRLGNWCGPLPSTPNAGCPALDTGYPTVVQSTVSGSRICLFQPSSGLRRSITVTSGGRVHMVEP
jgi:hypothetical protein